MTIRSILRLLLLSGLVAGVGAPATAATLYSFSATIDAPGIPSFGTGSSVIYSGLLSDPTVVVDSDGRSVSNIGSSTLVIGGVAQSVDAARIQLNPTQTRFSILVSFLGPNDPDILIAFAIPPAGAADFPEMRFMLGDAGYVNDFAEINEDGVLPATLSLRSFSATDAIPEPSAALLFLAGGIVVARGVRGRTLVR